MEQTWGRGWYLVPALEHYRYHRIFVTETRSERISNIVDFFPQSVETPRIYSADSATLAARDLL